MGIVPTSPIVRGTVSVGVWAMNDETPPRGGSAGAGCRCGFLPPTGDVTQEHVVEVSLPTPAALNQSQGGNYMDSGIKTGLRVSEEFLGGFSFMYFSPWC